MTIYVKLKKLKSGPKKYEVNIINKNSDRSKNIKFGARGYSDYTIHKDKERKERYIARHRARENWTKSGIKTAGFWSRWLLWNKPSISASKKNISSRFGVKFI